MARSYKVEWNPKARRYAFRTPAGGYSFFSESQVEAIVDNDIDVSGARMGKIGSALNDAAQNYKDGKIDQGAYLDAVREWRDSMAAQMKGTHLGQAALAVGGVENMGPREHGRVGGLLGVQARYLENAAAEFAADPDLAAGEVPGRMGAEQRSPLYAKSSRYTYERCADIYQGENGRPWIINDLEPGAHHCQAKPGQPEHKSCPGQTALGAVRYDDPQRVCSGRRICGPECKCGSRRFPTKKAALAAIAN